MSRIRFALTASGAIAQQSELAIYAKTNRKLYTVDEEGNESQVLTSQDNIVKFSTVPVILTQENISDGYVDLPNIADGSFFQLIRERLVYLEGDDFELSEVDGVTRVTFSGPLASGGDEFLEADEQIVFCYTR